MAQLQLKESAAIDSELVVQDNKSKMDLVLGLIFVGALVVSKWLNVHGLGDRELLNLAQSVSILSFGVGTGAHLARAGFTNGITNLKI